MNRHEIIKFIWIAGIVILWTISVYRVGYWQGTNEMYKKVDVMFNKLSVAIENEVKYETN